MRWTGQIQPRFGETYTFITRSDDGVRLWVNNQLTINNWTDHAPTENQAALALTAGQRYDIKLEYYENGGQSAIKLEWQSASEPRAVVPALQLYPSATGVTLGAGVCSANNNSAFDVSFVNNTADTVDVYLVNTGCQEKYYKTLTPGETYLQHTYLTNVWRIKQQSNSAVLKQVVINNSSPVPVP
ncbi:MAG: PA14 domain-containing protein [Chloroflexota bacterium]|nr:PA14 domain-containing protein [Chloroflexota bacterium]